MENSHFPSKSGGMYNRKIREGGFSWVFMGAWFWLLVVCYGVSFYFCFDLEAVLQTCLIHKYSSSPQKGTFIAKKANNVL